MYEWKRCSKNLGLWSADLNCSTCPCYQFFVYSKIIQQILSIHDKIFLRNYNTPVWYIRKMVRKQVLRVLITRKITFFPFFFCIYMRCWTFARHIVLVISQYVSEVVMLYGFGLYSAICQWYLTTLEKINSE